MIKGGRQKERLKVGVSERGDRERKRGREKREEGERVGKKEAARGWERERGKRG